MSEIKKYELGRLKHLFPVGVVSFLISIVITAVIVIVFSFSGLISNEQNRKETVSKTPAISRTVKKEMKILNTYEWINKDSGTVRIPVERAMELLVTESKFQPGDTLKSDE